MTSRYAHKRLATLLTAVQTPDPARVIEWPQKVHHPAEQRGHQAATVKSSRKGKYASK